MKIVFISVLACLFTFIVWKSYKMEEKKKLGLQYVRSLPELPFLFVKNAPGIKQHPVIINYFDPGCEHCQYLARQLNKIDSIFQGVAFIMITRANKEATHDFIKEFTLDRLDNVSVAIDTSDSFLKLFGSNQVPSFFIYNTTHHLLKRINGEASLTALIRIIKNGK